MIIDDNLAVIHAYLCADGYVIRNPPSQKQKYYKIGLRNMNLILLKDFQNKFKKVFKIAPHLRKDGRCEKGSKEIYETLINRFGSFHSNSWSIQDMNKKQKKVWLRTFFDCEGWVFCKHHQNRHIGLDSINEKGLDKIMIMLKEFEIKTIKKIVKGGKMFRIFIYSKENLIKFKERIGFLHPEKKEKLDNAIKDFVEYKWEFPKKERELKKFIKQKLKEKIRIKKPYYIRIISKEEMNLKKLSKFLKKLYNIESLLYKSVNGIGTIYYELNINKKKDIQKLIKLKIIPNILENV